MISPLAQRFRTVVALWILVGLGGSPMAAVFGILALTGTAMFADKASFTVDAEFAPGEEVSTSSVRPGDIVVLAYPEDVALSTVECTVKSRVYSTGAQDVDTVVADAPDGVAPVLRSEGPEPRRFATITIVDFMGSDYISCTGEGAESFAITTARGVHTDGFRYAAGAVCLVFSVILLGLGLLALHLTRTWSRQAAQPYPPYPPQGYAYAPRPPAPAPLPPDHNPYAPPPQSTD